MYWHKTVKLQQQRGTVFDVSHILLQRFLQLLFHWPIYEVVTFRID